MVNLTSVMGLVKTRIKKLTARIFPCQTSRIILKNRTNKGSIRRSNALSARQIGQLTSSGGMNVAVYRKKQSSNYGKRIKLAMTTQI